MSKGGPHWHFETRTNLDEFYGRRVSLRSRGVYSCGRESVRGDIDGR